MRWRCRRCVRRPGSGSGVTRVCPFEGDLSLCSEWLVTAESEKNGSSLEHGFSRLLGVAGRRRRRFERRGVSRDAPPPRVVFRPAQPSVAGRTGRRDAESHRADAGTGRRDRGAPAGALLLRHARFVLLEDVRNASTPTFRSKAHAARRSARAGPDRHPRPEEDEAATKEQRLGCLERCLDTLKPEQRELIVGYHREPAGKNRAPPRPGEAVRHLDERPGDSRLPHPRRARSRASRGAAPANEMDSRPSSYRD